MASEVKSSNLVIITTTGQTSQSNPNVTFINAAYSMNANDQVIVFDSNGTSGNVDLPSAQNGKQLLFTPNNVGGTGVASYTLIVNGGDTFDPAATQSLTAFAPVRIIGINGVWYSA